MLFGKMPIEVGEPVYKGWLKKWRLKGTLLLKQVFITEEK